MTYVLKLLCAECHCYDYRGGYMTSFKELWSSFVNYFAKTPYLIVTLKWLSVMLLICSPVTCVLNLSGLIKKTNKLGRSLAHLNNNLLGNMTALQVSFQTQHCSKGINHTHLSVDSRCDSVGRPVAYNTTDLWFESCVQQIWFTIKFIAIFNW